MIKQRVWLGGGGGGVGWVGVSGEGVMSLDFVIQRVFKYFIRTIK